MAHSFDLHAPVGANKDKKMLGRGQGSGRGTTSGRGNKGQNSRSGGRTYIGFEGGQMPHYRKLAQRGFSNYPFKKSYQIVNLVEIEKRFNDGDTVSEVTLFEKRLIKGRKNGDSFVPDNPVKILGNGDLTKKITIEVNNVSGSAREKVLKAGGKVPAAAMSAAENAGKTGSKSKAGNDSE